MCLFLSKKDILFFILFILFVSFRIFYILFVSFSDILYPFCILFGYFISFLYPFRISFLSFLSFSDILFILFILFGYPFIFFGYFFCIETNMILIYFVHLCLQFHFEFINWIETNGDKLCGQDASRVPGFS